MNLNCYFATAVAQSTMHPSWSDIPLELAQEIAGHNADDRATLRAMSLFACAEDFAQWLDILGRTPMLETVVKAAKFFEADRDWLRRWRRLKSAAPLGGCTAPPVIPALPSVRSVEWDGMSMSYANSNSVAMAVAYMALFPNVDTLRLCGMEFGFAALASLLGACGQLKRLSFHAATAEEGDSDSEIDSGADLPLFDLTALEELVAAWSRGEIYQRNPIGATSHQADFRVALYDEVDEADTEEFDKILRDLLPWRRPASESMKTVLARKFPSCQKIEFHFCIPRDSDMHFRRGLRRSRERRLRDRLEANGARIPDLLRVEWLDKAYKPVMYSETNGKPPWRWMNRHPEPETEASDCEYEKSSADSEAWDSDGYPVIRVWTEAHERAYRREMLTECGYSHEEGYYDSDEEDG
ncbi:hypothetical protein B0H14DRAFT_3583484 [Mycena olivaceomarginata]|nr:hypothetical protein B0H14DRAFT_3583484 [Mycena olivaceomarginata]